MKAWKKRALALVTAALCLVGGCGLPGIGRSDGDAAPVDNVRVSDAYFGLAWYQNGTLNPVLDNTSVNRLLCEALYEGLFEVTDSFTADGVLCSEYTGDGTTFTFTLKDRVTFWSGQELTAADVVASLQTALWNESSPYHNRLTEVSSIEEVDNRTVRIVLTSPNVNFPRLLDIPIYRAGSGDSGAFADGTGPYHPVKEGSQWKLEANTSWNGGFLGTIRTISLVTMTRADAAQSSFKTGDVSLLRQPRIAPDGQATLTGGAIDTVRTASADMHYLGINYSNGRLANAKVRRALSMALSRQSLCETQLQTFATPAVLPVNPQPSDESLALSMQADTENAVRLLREGLQEAAATPEPEPEPDTSDDGSYDDSYDDTDYTDDSDYDDDSYDNYDDSDYYDEDSDAAGGFSVQMLGVARETKPQVFLLTGENDGASDSTDGAAPADESALGAAANEGAVENAALSIRLLVNANNAFKVAAAEQIAASWQAIGVTVTVDKQPYDTYVSMLQSGDFDVYYGETLLTADFDLRPLLSSGGSLNYGGFSNEDMSNALAASRKGDSVTAYYTTFLDQMPVIPIAFECGQLIIRKGLIDNFHPAPYNAFAGQENWTMPGVSAE